MYIYIYMFYIYMHTCHIYIYIYMNMASMLLMAVRSDRLRDGPFPIPLGAKEQNRE